MLMLTRMVFLDRAQMSNCDGEALSDHFCSYSSVNLEE